MVFDRCAKYSVRKSHSKKSFVVGSNPSGLILVGKIGEEFVPGLSIGSQ